ncbi:acetyl-CoA synthetase-like protein [Thozetella sp. PMI_491]|nr:acetyl-CoA synthetase-like protein [Thozetella sp. PMI_491]
MALSETHGVVLPESTPSLWEQFTNCVHNSPDSLALVCVQQPSDLYGISSIPLDKEKREIAQYLRWTYRQLREVILRLSDRLKGLGVKDGAPVFTFLGNGVQWVLASWSATESGYIFVPLSGRNLSNREESVHMVKTALLSIPCRPAVVIADPDWTDAIDALGLFDQTIRLVSAGPRIGDWLSFEQLLSNADSNDESNISPGNLTDATTLFTSGTASKSKGCLKRYPSWGATIKVRESSPSKDGIGSNSIFGSVVPNNHVFGRLVLHLSHCSGATLVYPGPYFNPSRVLEVFSLERITQVTPRIAKDYIVSFTGLVPSMAYALIEAMNFSPFRPKSLISIILAGSTVTADMVRLCMKELSKGVEILWGMTEGPLTRTGNQRNISTLVCKLNPDEVMVGWVQPGNWIKIVDPRTGKTVTRNILGEIHAHGPLLIDSYLGDADNSSFYNNRNGRQWFRTGDQGRIDEQSRLFVTGRYKDIIIRGGVNISPAAVEAVINGNELAYLQAQVVGASDDIAGEVPIAVVLAKVDAEIREAVKSSVLERMGTAYVPEDIIQVTDLSINDYPRTLSGKIQKAKLAQLVKVYRLNNGSAPPDSRITQLVEDVKLIWSQALGLPPDRLSMGSPIVEFADSLTVMRVRDRIRKKTGKTLPLTEMKTIAMQIAILRQEDLPNFEQHPVGHTKSDEPPGIDNITHTIEDPGAFALTKSVVLEAITPQGFTWDDIEDIMPAYDFGIMMTTGTKLYDSYGFRFGILAKRADRARLKTAFETTLRNNRILLSFLVQSQTLFGYPGGLHVVMRQSSKLSNIVLQDGDALRSVEELKMKVLNYPYPSHDAIPGPLTRIMFYDIQETNSAAAVLCINHAVMDGTMLQILNEDLEQALEQTPKLHNHLDYKLWADTYHGLRTSGGAKTAVRWHLNRLRGVAAHKKALYPSHSHHGPAGHNDDIVRHSFDIPGLQELRCNHPHLASSILPKTALALFNIYRTGHTHALFTNLEAVRSNFPFLPAAVEALSSPVDASDVAGPTMHGVINFVEVRAEETVISLLNRMQHDQTSLTRYAAAPCYDIMSELGPVDGAMVPNIFMAQIYNWVPGRGAAETESESPYKNFELVQVGVQPRGESSTEVGLDLEAGLGGQNSSTMFFLLRGDGFARDEYEKIASELEKLTTALAKRENWNCPVGDILAQL